MLAAAHKLVMIILFRFHQHQWHVCSSFLLVFCMLLPGTTPNLFSEYPDNFSCQQSTMTFPFLPLPFILTPRQKSLYQLFYNFLCLSFILMIIFQMTAIALSAISNLMFPLLQHASLTLFLSLVVSPREIILPLSTGTCKK